MIYYILYWLSRVLSIYVWYRGGIVYDVQYVLYGLIKPGFYNSGLIPGFLQYDLIQGFLQHDLIQGFLHHDLVQKIYKDIVRPSRLFNLSRLFVVVISGGDVSAPQIGAETSSPEMTTTNGEIKVVGVVGGTQQGSTYHPYHFYFCTTRLPARKAPAVEWSRKKKCHGTEKKVVPKKVCLWWSRKKSCTGHPKR